MLRMTRYAQQMKNSKLEPHRISTRSAKFPTMCIGENCAPQAWRFINSQLATLHENAVECMQQHENAQRSDDHFRYAHALADFYYQKLRLRQPAQYDAMFHVKFDKPSLEFVCNHDAILHINIREGHFYLDHNKTFTGSVPDGSPVQELSQIELLFRVGFDIRSVNTQERLGNGKNVINVVVFDLPKAKLISEDAIVAGKPALAFYMKKYLEFLQDAGNNILFSLPDFDISRTQLKIDYSELLEHPFRFTDQIYGVSMATINEQLSSSWIKAAMLAGGILGQNIDWKATALAEYRGPWASHDATVQFNIKFGAPRINAVCSKEVILYISLNEITFYQDEESPDNKPYTGWEIAIMTDIVCEEDIDGTLSWCKIDANNVRFCYELCQTPGYEDADDITLQYFDNLLEFLGGQYLHILEGTGQLTIYDSRRSSFRFAGDEDSLSWDTDVTGDSVHGRMASWRQIINKSEMYGFDQVIAISQASINTDLKSLWDSAIVSGVEGHASLLAKWSFGDYCSVEFAPMRIRLLSDERAVVLIRLKKGFLKTMRNRQPWDESEQHPFEDWQIAYIADLKMVNHDDLGGVDGANDSSAYNQHINQIDRNLQHIRLDLSNVEFSHEHSRFDNLLQSQDANPIEKIRAMLWYIKTEYLPALIDKRLDVILSIPVWTPNVGESLPVHAWTDVAYRVSSNATSTSPIQLWQQSSDTTESAIILYGMTHSRQMPSTHFQLSSNWTIQGGRMLSHGTLSLSRDVALEQDLLVRLARINAHTTIIPQFASVTVEDNGLSNLRLLTWAQDREKAAQECRWSAGPPQRDGARQYEWEHRAFFSYENEGTFAAKGACSVACTTRNLASLSAVVGGGAMELQLSGEILLEVIYTANQRAGRAKTTAKWNASIVLQSNTGGIKVNVVHNVNPQLAKPEFDGDLSRNVADQIQQLLEAQLPKSNNFEEVLQNLRQFEGTWQACYLNSQAYCLSNPTFNARGDLLFELRTENQAKGQVPTRTAMKRSIGGRPGGRAYGSRYTPGPRVGGPPSYYSGSASYFSNVMNGDGVVQTTVRSAAQSPISPLVSPGIHPVEGYEIDIPRPSSRASEWSDKGEVQPTRPVSRVGKRAGTAEAQPLRSPNPTPTQHVAGGRAGRPSYLQGNTART